MPVKVQTDLAQLTEKNFLKTTALIFECSVYLLVNEKASLSPEMAIRISKATNTSVESWMNMQQKLTLWNALQHEPDNVIIDIKKET